MHKCQTWEKRVVAEDLAHWRALAGEQSTLKVKGLFYGIGHQPNSHLFADVVDLDDGGYVKVPHTHVENNDKAFFVGLPESSTCHAYFLLVMP